MSLSVQTPKEIDPMRAHGPDLMLAALALCTAFAVSLAAGSWHAGDHPAAHVTLAQHSYAHDGPVIAR
jgi:hypothetical protein